MMNKILTCLLLLALVIGIAASCQDDEDTSDSSTGSRSSPCDTVRCGYGANCIVVSGRARCECPSICPAIYDPVCGSDGKTYSNSCQLRVRECNSKKQIQIDHKGAC